MGWNPSSTSSYVDVYGARRARNVASSWVPAAAAPFLSPGSQPTPPQTVLEQMERVRGPGRQLGAIPGGWTQTEWDKLTPSQQTDYLSKDAATQAEVRKLISQGVEGGLALIKAGIASAQADKDGERALELARIQAKERTDIAKIQAASGQQVTGSTTSTTTTTPTLTILPLAKDVAASSSKTGIIVAAAAAGGLLLLFGRKKRRR